MACLSDGRGTNQSAPANLCYTLAFDKPGVNTCGRMARLLVTSLLRVNWRGPIVVFRSSGPPLFPEGNSVVQEVAVDFEEGDSWDEMVRWKYAARTRLDLNGIGKVLFLDCDCVVLREINHLLFGGWDIYTAPEPSRVIEFPFNGLLTESERSALKNEPGVNSGAFGVRASRFMEVMEQWEEIENRPWQPPHHFHDQHSWNRLLLDTPLRQRPFARNEIEMPFVRTVSQHDLLRASIVHAAGGSAEEKLEVLYGLWVAKFGWEAFESMVKPG